MVVQLLKFTPLEIFCVGREHAIQTEEDLENLGPREPRPQPYGQAPEAPRRPR